jgi:hypothetical protein
MNESPSTPGRRRPDRRAATLRSARELGQKTSAEANRRAAGILETLAGLRSAPEVAAALGLSLPYFYLLERKALDGLVRACEAQAKGPAGPSADEQVARLRRELAQAQRECQRLTALVRVTQRAVGLAPPASDNPTRPASGGKPRRRRRPVARALRAADTLRKNSSGSAAADGLERSPAGSEKSVAEAAAAGHEEARAQEAAHGG